VHYITSSPSRLRLNELGSKTILSRISKKSATWILNAEQHLIEELGHEGILTAKDVEKLQEVSLLSFLSCLFFSSVFLAGTRKSTSVSICHTQEVQHDMDHANANSGVRWVVKSAVNYFIGNTTQLHD